MNEFCPALVIPSPDPVVGKLPPILRIQSLARLPFDARHTLNRAVLFHEWVSLTAEWIMRHVDGRLTAGSLTHTWVGARSCWHRPADPHRQGA